MTCKLNEVYPSITTYLYGFFYLAFGIIVGYKAFKNVQIAKHHAIDKHTHATKDQNLVIEEKSQETAATSNVTSDSQQNTITNTTVNRHISAITKELSKDGKIKECTLMKLWLYDTYLRRKCYLPVLTHIIDQMTDVGVIVAFALLYIEEEEKGDNYCEDINPLWLLILSLCSFWFYRIISAISIYFQTKSIFRLLLQLFDFELFRALLVNYKLNSERPSNPQRWIQSLEAVWEAFPQSLIQLFYIYKTNQTDFLVVFSVIWSFWSIINKTANEDKLLLNDDYQNFNGKCGSKYIRKLECVSFKYLFGIGYRTFDIVNITFVLLLSWLFMGGFITFLILMSQFVLLSIVALKAKEFGGSLSD